MRAVDGWIAGIGAVALGLAVLVVLRAREATQPASRILVPPTHVGLPPESDFPACQAQPQGLDRWRCQARQATRQGRIRCIGQRLYYVIPGTGNEASRMYRWPPAVQCSTDAATVGP